MSIPATVWAWNNEVCCSTERLLLLALAFRSDDLNQCWASFSHLREITCIKSDTTIAKYLDALEKKELIVRRHRYKKVRGLTVKTSNMYHLCVDGYPHAREKSGQPKKPEKQNNTTSTNPKQTPLPKKDKTQFFEEIRKILRGSKS